VIDEILQITKKNLQNAAERDEPVLWMQPANSRQPSAEFSQAKSSCNTTTNNIFVPERRINCESIQILPTRTQLDSALAERQSKSSTTTKVIFRKRGTRFACATKNRPGARGPEALGEASGSEP
jgi:hypothetical protein